MKHVKASWFRGNAVLKRCKYDDGLDNWPQLSTFVGQSYYGAMKQLQPNVIANFAKQLL